jgi:hypothetical protein
VHHLLRLALFVVFVVREEVEVRDADGDDEMNGCGFGQMRNDRVAHSCLAAVRVSDHEKSLLAVGRFRRRQGANARSLERDRCQRG